MKRFCLSLLTSALLTTPLLAQSGSNTRTAPPPQTMVEQASYAIGLNIGRNIKSQQLDVSAVMVARGMMDALAGTKPALTDAQLQSALEAFERAAQARMQEKAAKAKQAGEAFLAANAKKAGVKTLASGLQYKVLKSGNGPRPKATDTVRTHYHGTLIDGTVFDSSVQRGEPAEFPVNRVIPGWTEALQLMKVGDKWQLFVPSDMAYGPQGRPPVIPPNSTLVFEVELLDVLK